MKKRLKNYFVPYQGNDYKPHSLQKTAVVCMSILVLLTFAFANLQALLWMNSSWLVSTVLPAVVVDLTNETRGDVALGSLTRNTTLDRAAQLKAEHMARNSYFAHYAPDGTSPWYWFDTAGYNYIHAGENLAVHFTDSDEVVDAWMNSPSHRENILNGNYTEIGVGTAKGEYQGYETVFVVQLFGTPVKSAGTLALAKPTPSETAVAVETNPAPTPVTVPPPVPVAAVDTKPEPEAVPEPAPVTETEVTEVVNNSNEPVLLVSDTAETSQVVAGAEFAEPASMPNQPISTAARMATQPQTILNMVYAVTAMFVLAALLTSILIEIRKQHPVQIAYGTGLLAMMAVLAYVHLTIAGGAVIM